MVHEVDDGCQELAHVRFDVVRAGEQFGNLVGEVGGDYLVEPSLFIGFVECSHAVCEQTEGRTDEDTSCVHLL